MIWAANFCGYLWKKYCDEVSCADRKATSDIDFMLMRYAEILLIYAEAKIELGEIDQTMLDASINRVRARAYGKHQSAHPDIHVLLHWIKGHYVQSLSVKEKWSSLTKVSVCSTFVVGELQLK